jgi:hypothetical protein
MTTSDERGDRIFHGACTFKNLYPNSGCITNTHISSDANNRIASAKVVHRLDLHYGQADGADVVAATKLLRICRGDGLLLGVQVRPTTAPTGGDKAFTVDIQKDADGGGSWSSLLSSVVTVNSSSVDDTKQNGTLIGDPSTDATDALRVVVAVSGSTGSQGQGFVVSVFYEEDPS